MAQWKSDMTILESNMDSLTNMIKFSTTLSNLLEEISSYIDQTSLEGSWLRSISFRSEREKIARLYEQRSPN